MALRLPDKARLLWHIARWRLTWARRDTGFVPPGLGARFVSARDAVTRIPAGATVVSCGLAANARCSIFYWALRERFDATATPSGLTWISVGAQGGRGRVPGTVEELAAPGLLARYITGHAETAKALLANADTGELELHVLPQGEMTHLIEGQARGDRSLVSRTGIGTFLDPRTGRGSGVTPGAASLVQAHGENLTYTLPVIDVAMFSAPYADRDGNVYFSDAATITENVEAARAAKANGGRVLAAVAGLIPRDDARIGLAADMIDAIVVNPSNEQTGSVKQRTFWPMFTVGGAADEHEAEAQLRFLNTVLHITPSRGPVANALARLGARVFTEQVGQDATVNIGVGYPEEVCRLLRASGLHDALTFTTETGVYGGLPAPGIFFGAAINPTAMHSSAWMFHHYERHLDVTLLGFLQVDSAGNVNASRRGPRMLDYVGPGGFPSIVAAARNVIFVGAWHAGGRLRIRNGTLHMEGAGKPKFVEQVDEVTFSAAEALRLGKRVFYVTNVGVFRLTPEGLMLIQVVPGIDVVRDILSTSRASIVVPPDGPTMLPASILTGEGFTLRWNDAGAEDHSEFDDARR